MSDERRDTMSPVVDAINAMVAKLVEASDRQTKEMSEASDRQTKVISLEIRKSLGREGGATGRVAEAVVAETLSWYMDRYFDMKINDQTRRRLPLKNRRTGKDASDVDVLGVGDDNVVVVEVKNTISESQVAEFRRRLYSFAKGDYYTTADNPL